MKHFKSFLPVLLCLVSSVLLTAVAVSAAGYTVSGQVTTFNPANPVSVSFCQNGNVIVSGQIPAEEGSDPVTQTFTLSDVPEGTYDLVVEKACHLTYTVTGVDVNRSLDLTLSPSSEVSKIELAVGDISDDGFIDGNDITMLIFDLGKTDEDCLYPLSDLNGDRYRDALDVTTLSFNLLKTSSEVSYVAPPDEGGEDEDDTSVTVLHSFDSAGNGGWWGTVSPIWKTTDAFEGSGYFAADLPAAGSHTICGNLYAEIPNAPTAPESDLYPIESADALDVSAEDHMTMAVYVSDADAVSGITMYLASCRNGPLPSRRWVSVIDTVGFTDGWNTVSFALSDGSAGADFEPDNVQYLMLTVDCNAACSVGFDYWCGVTGDDPVTPPAPADPDEDASSTVLYSFDSVGTGLWWGTVSPVWKTADAFEGSGYVAAQIPGSGSHIVCGNLYAEKPNAPTAPESDLYPIESAGSIDVAAEGHMTLAIYVSDADAVSSVTVHLSSCRNGPLPSRSWNTTIDAAGFVDGWNTVSFSLADSPAGQDFEPDNVQYISLTVNSTAACEVGFDAFFGVTAAADEKRDPAVEAVAYQNGLRNEGSDAIRAAIADVFARAEAGEAITIACLGDSITQGAGAATLYTSWVQLVNSWFKDTFPDNADIRMINAGISSTEATLGSARVHKHVLDYEPDFVIVDFGVNDYSMPYPQETYEGVVTQILGAHIPVLNYNACPENGNNTEDMDYAVNLLYGIPQLSMRKSYYELSRSDEPGYYKPERIWYPDHVHPSDIGHHLMADMMIRYLESVLADYHDGNITPAPLTGALPEPLTDNHYGDSILFGSDSENTGYASYETDSFTADYVAVTGNDTMHGWRCYVNGGTITFTTTAGYATLYYRGCSEVSKISVTVDGKNAGIVYAYGTGDWNLCAFDLMHTDPGVEHTIVCTVLPETAYGTCGFEITSLALSNFN